ncbi:hypothetical protein [Streptomyces sp. NPDC007172]|uniref:hypothetical protein n=1 Tax=Streptomyces sp. NPDC007172 TaxID=3364776 RepID=UPI0036B26285
MSDDHGEELSNLVGQLGAGIHELHYRPAYDAAANICSGVFETIPVDLHDVVHEGVMAGYAAALRDLEEGRIDDRVRERSELLE